MEDKGNPRVDCRLTLTVHYPETSIEQFAERAGNVGAEGVFVRTDRPLSRGTRCNLEIRLADGASILVGGGQVVLSRERIDSTRDRPAGMGIKFLWLDETLSPALRHLPAGPAWARDQPPEGALDGLSQLS